jgi:small subunit ribosomal protein S14
MLYAKIKDKKHRESFSRLEKKKLLNKFVLTFFLSKQLESHKKEINLAVLKNVLNEKYNSKVRVNRRCVMNNRSRGVLRNFGVSRMRFRELLSFGLVPGYSKAVW